MQSNDVSEKSLLARPRKPLALSSFVLAGLVLAPSHFGPPGVLDRVLVALAVVAVAASLFLRRGVGHPRRRTIRILIMAAGVSGLLAINIFLLTLTQGTEFGYRDYFELARYPIYAIFAAEMIQLSRSRPRQVVYTADSIALAVPLLAAGSYVIVYFGLPGADLISDIFAETKTSFRGVGDARVSVPFGNPNVLGAASVLSFVWAAFFKSRVSRLTRIVAPFSVLLSGSRGAWIGLLFVVVILGCVLISTRMRKKLGVTIATFLLLVAVAGGGLFVVQELSETRRVGRTIALFEARTIEAERNLEVRVDVSLRAATLWMQRPVLGQGPQKTLSETPLDSIDNQYASILVRHGILGLILIFAFYFQIVRAIIVRHNCGASLRIKVFLAVAFVLLIPAAHFDNFRFWAMWLILLVGLGSYAVESSDSRITSVDHVVQANASRRQ